MLYLLYALMFVVVLFVSEYLIHLSIPMIQEYFPSFSVEFLDAALLSLIILPIVMAIFLTQKVVARHLEVRKLQFKISLIGAVPLISALALILFFIQSRYEVYQETDDVLKILPSAQAVSEAIYQLEAHRDADFQKVNDVNNSEHAKTYHKLAEQLDRLRNQFMSLPENEQFNYSSYLGAISQLLEDEELETHSEETTLSRFETYSEAISMLSVLHTELLFTNKNLVADGLDTFLYQMESVRKTLIAERTLLSQVFRRGYFLPEEHNLFVQQRSRMAAWQAELADTVNSDLSLLYQNYVYSSAANNIELIKTKITDDSYRNIIINVNRLIGYGGAIHNFKNYVLRKEPRFRALFLKQADELQNSLTSLKDYFPESQRLTTQVEAIQKVITGYQEKVEVLENGIVSGLSAEQLDDLVRIDDSEALSALRAINEFEVYDYPVAEWREQTFKDAETVKQLITSLTADFEQQLRDEASTQKLLLVFLFLFSAFLLIMSALLGINITTQVVLAYQQQRRLKIEAEQATVAKSDFLANMSHEIRSPMNGIMGLVQMLQDTELKEQQRNYLQHIEQSTQSLLRIINDILDYSKLDAKKVELELLPLEIKPFFELIYNLHIASCDDKHLDYQLNLAEDLPDFCIADSVRLQQVISNLVSNAVKFTSRGEVTIHVSKVDDELEVSVSDTGIGMKKEQLEKIFIRFEQADTSTTRKYGGTGLGVNIAKELTELMGGELLADSTYRTGSLFTIRIPVTWLNSIEGQHDVKQEEEIDDSILKDISLLVVEDNKVNLMVVKGFLKKFGVDSLYYAENGEKAITTVQRLSENGVDLSLILMDCQMPVMDGYEATEKLREQGFEIPIIALTANAMVGDRERCIEVGMNDFVPKPIDKAHFKRTLLKWVH